jgi:dTDP-4-amino-4,6-dideoxygalactose transaminase
VPYLKLLPAPQPGAYFDVFTNYVIRAHERDKLVAYLRECGIEVLISWPKPLHHQKALGLEHFNLPVTVQISREVVSLPLNTEITDEQVEFVVQTVRKFYAG